MGFRLKCVPPQNGYLIIRAILKIPTADQRDRARETQHHPGDGLAAFAGLREHAGVLDEPADGSRPGAKPTQTAVPASRKCGQSIVNKFRFLLLRYVFNDTPLITAVNYGDFDPLQ